MDKETAVAIEKVARGDGHLAFVSLGSHTAGGDTEYSLRFERADFSVAYVATTLREAQEYIVRQSAVMH